MKTVLEALALLGGAYSGTTLFLVLFLVAGALWKGVQKRVSGDAKIEEKGGPKFCFVIPAHNEGAGVAATVENLKRQEWPQEQVQILVLADNCTDDTAHHAQAAGAVVFERFDDTKKSKGFALEWFFQSALASETFQGVDAFVVVDADTVADEALLKHFAAGLGKGWDWQQAFYGVSNPNASWRTRLLVFALALFNGVWLLGLEAWGLSLPLRGNGMCFSAKGLRRIPWSCSGLAEDMEFAWELRLKGERVHYASGAAVFGEMVSEGKRAASQRKRWEEGRALIRKIYGARLRASPLSLWKKLIYALDLWAKPLGTSVAALTLSTVLAVGALFWDATWGVFTELVWWALCLQWVGLFLYLLSPRLLLGLPLRRYLDLSFAPFYILWKLALNFRKGPSGWVRTAREASPKGENRP